MDGISLHASNVMALNIRVELRMSHANIPAVMQMEAAIQNLRNRATHAMAIFLQRGMIQHLGRRQNLYRMLLHHRYTVSVRINSIL
jgi:hypothetical protein